MGKEKKLRGKYEAAKHSKAKCFLRILGEAEIHPVTKTQNMEIANCYIFRTTLFHVKFSKTILDEAETHATLKTWEK